MAYDQNAADAIAELADARHELDVLRGGIANLRQWFSLALGELTQAQAERDEARRAAASWEEWGQGWKGQAEGSRTARDKAWAELDQVRAELVTAVREVADLRALFDLQWKRMAEATERWRAEDPEARALVMPDLGDLLQWLMADADRLRAERDRAVAHDRQPYPTADAYEAACAALEKHRERADRAEAERDQLRYERRLLGFARHVLDRAAEFHNLRPVDREHVEREAADVAQRIVAEIGHPVTDEPALGPTYREQIAALAAERDQLRQHILDIDAHATPYGDIPDEPGWVGTYLVTAGALHRALGKIGHSAPKCEAEARLAAIEQHARDAGTRLLELQAERGELALALERVTAERDRRGDELRRARAVIEAAKAWRRARYDDALIDRLAAAIDALDHGGGGRHE